MTVRVSGIANPMPASRRYTRQSPDSEPVSGTGCSASAMRNESTTRSSATSSSVRSWRCSSPRGVATPWKLRLENPASASMRMTRPEIAGRVVSAVLVTATGRSWAVDVTAAASVSRSSVSARAGRAGSQINATNAPINATTAPMITV